MSTDCTSEQLGMPIKLNLDVNFCVVCFFLLISRFCYKVYILGMGIKY